MPKNTPFPVPLKYANALNDAPTKSLSTWAVPDMVFFADLSVAVGALQEVGNTALGFRRVIPIVGGNARGVGWAARVLPGGADFQLVVSPSQALLDARYCLETDGGDLIYVRNRAMRNGPAALMQRLLAGELLSPTESAQVYFRCTPTFETACPALLWINERLFVGTGARLPGSVEMRFFELN